MQHVRTRPIDDNKPLIVVHSIDKQKQTSTEPEIKELDKIKKSLLKVVQHFDNLKKIQLPKSFSNNENNNEKNERPANSHKKKSAAPINNTNNTNQDILDYSKLTEYKRPAHYIIYNSREKENEADYEAKTSDRTFLKYLVDIRQIKIEIEVLEKIISTLENNIGKGEKIPDEMAKKIVEEKFPIVKDKSDLIINYFYERRKEAKKSLLRKYWHKQKSDDKNINSTFRRRERDKMKIRKNNQKKEESFAKVKEASDLCQNHLVTLVNNMMQKESLVKEKFRVENCVFLSQCYSDDSTSVSMDAIKREKNFILEQVEEIIAPLKNTEIKPEPPKINDQNYQQKKDTKNLYNFDKVNVPGEGSDSTEISIADKRRKKPKNDKIEDIKEKLEDFNILIDLNVLEDDKENYEKPKQKDMSNLRMRIRQNRSGGISIDRYQQNDNGFDPFGDEFNAQLKIQKNENIKDCSYYVKNYRNKDTFEGLFQNFYDDIRKMAIYLEGKEEEVYPQYCRKNGKSFLNKKRFPNSS